MAGARDDLAGAGEAAGADGDSLSERSAIEGVDAAGAEKGVALADPNAGREVLAEGVAAGEGVDEGVDFTAGAGVDAAAGEGEGETTVGAGELVEASAGVDGGAEV